MEIWVLFEFFSFFFSFGLILFYDVFVLEYVRRYACVNAVSLQNKFFYKKSNLNLNNKQQWLLISRGR